MIPDLVFLWSLFSDVHQAVGGPVPFADFVKADAELLSDVRGIVEGAPSNDQAGSFWQFPHGQIPLDDAMDSRLGDVLRTLRNGYAHSHWFHADLSAIDYWRELGWTSMGPIHDSTCEAARARTMMYVADAHVRVWDPANFWT